MTQYTNTIYILLGKITQKNTIPPTYLLLPLIYIVDFNIYTTKSTFIITLHIKLDRQHILPTVRYIEGHFHKRG